MKKIIASIITGLVLSASPVYAYDHDCTQKLSVLWPDANEFVKMFYLFKSGHRQQAVDTLIKDKAYYLNSGTCFDVTGVRRIRSITLLKVHITSPGTSYAEDGQVHTRNGYIFVDW